jgi:hypothetical protein
MSRLTSKFTLLAAAFGLALTATAEAHEAASAVLRVQVAGDHANVTYAMPLRSLAAVVPNLDPNSDGLLSLTEANAAAAALADVLLPRLRLTAAQGTLSPSVVGALVPKVAFLPLGQDQTLVGVVLRYPAPASELRVHYRVPATSSLPRKLVVETPEGSAGVLGDGQHELTWRPATDFEVAVAMAMEGTSHIFAGWDHLAFLLALLIVAGKSRKVLLLVSAFTLAHSVTLGLTALGVVTPSGPVVEAVIALSIVYVAMENLMLGGGKHREVLTFAFGLIHGMGFGGALAELDLSNPVPALLGFNVGVEVGQLMVVAGVLPLLVLIKRRPVLYKRLIVTGGSLAIGGMGLFWLLERLATLA